VLHHFVNYLRERHSAAVEGAMWMVVSAISWSIMVAIARGLKDEIHTFEVVFFRSVFALIFMLPFFWNKKFSDLKTNRLGMHLVRGLSGVVSLYLLFGALVFLPMGEVAAITFTRPLMASICAILFLGEAARGNRWTAVIVGLIGAYIIIRPGVSPISFGQILALLCVAAMVITAMAVKSLARTEAADKIVMWQSIVFTTVTIGPAIHVWVTPNLTQFALLVLLGLTGATTQRAMTRAYKAADVTVILPFEYIRLPFAAIMGWLLFSEFPDIWVWFGGTLIFASTLFMAHNEERRDKNNKFQKQPNPRLK